MDGLLDETWVSGPGGIAQSVRLPGGRDFSQCAWSWRDPTASLVPVYFQEVQQPAHLDSELAGFVEQFILTNGTVASRGGFYDNAAGVRLRDTLLGGRKMGVSVDPTERVTTEFVCTDTDEYGDCIDGDLVFHAYEIGGFTATPLQGFDTASIMLDVPAEPVAASAEPAQRLRVGDATEFFRADPPVAPPSSWFSLAEPLLGAEFLPGILGDTVLIDQGNGSYACPLTITDDGLVYGHLARWGQCHVGFADQCVAPPSSLAAYQPFHTGNVLTAEGESVVTGALIVGCDHADRTATLWQAQDHYANAGSGWADVRASNGEHGVWVCGALRPGVTADQLRVLRALSLSGDWRRFGNGLELCAGLAVNSPGFPIARESLAAAAAMGIDADVAMRQWTVNGEPQSLVAAGRVQRCPECAQRARLGRSAAQFDAGFAKALAAIEEMRGSLDLLELRTRPLQRQAVEDARASLQP